MAFFQFPAGTLLFVNFCIYFFPSLPFPFIGILVRFGHIALFFLSFIPAIFEVGVFLMFCRHFVVYNNIKVRRVTVVRRIFLALLREWEG